MKKTIESILIERFKLVLKEMDDIMTKIPMGDNEEERYEEMRDGLKAHFVMSLYPTTATVEDIKGFLYAVKKLEF